MVREGALAAALTSLMILLFLGSWRSTIIIATSIPLSVLSALIGLWATGQTLNIMTLGGLALAVGILVDDATVTIENINWHLEHGKDVRTAIIDGARQIVQPAFVALLCICIVFVPMLTLQGVAGYLFIPMAISVVFAMIASFILSRTLVPTLSLYLLKPHLNGTHDAEAADHAMHLAQGDHFLARLQRRFESGFEAVRESYRNLLALALSRRRLFVVGFLATVLISFVLFPFLGSNFFPAVDTGQITVHVRPPIGTRLEDTTQQIADIEAEIRRVIPGREIAAIVDSLGIPQSSINQLYNSTGTIGTQDTDIFVSLTQDHHATPDYVKRLREILPRTFPSTNFSFPPADIVSQILNFGSPAPIDVQFTGIDHEATKAFAYKLLREIRRVPGIADPRMQQSDETPQLNFTVDRVRAAQVGLTEKDVTSALATSLAGTGQTAPNFFLNPKNGVSYGIVAQTPEYKLELAGGAAQSAGHRPGLFDFAGAGRAGQYHPHPFGGGGDALQRPAHHRSFRHHPGSRSGCGGGGCAEDHGPSSQRNAARRHHGNARSDRDHEHGLLGPQPGPDWRHRADLSSDRGEFPILARSLRHHHRAAGGAGRHRLDALHHRHHPVGSGTDRRADVHGRRHRQFDPGGQLRPRAPGRHRRRRAFGD